MAKSGGFERVSFSSAPHDRSISPNGNRVVWTIPMNLLRAFRFGRLPADASKLVALDALIVRVEYVWSSITYRDFSRGSTYCAWRRRWFAGSFAFSADRVIAYWGSSRLINVPFSDHRFSLLDLSRSDSTAIEISHDASLFHPTWSGRLQYRFHTNGASVVLGELAALRPACRMPPTCG